MNKFSATQKGLITGVAMLLVSVIIYYTKGNFENKLQYITYSVYVAGIVWTLVEFSKSNHTSKFGAYFSQGFKCFIVVTLLMVIFTAAFLLLQPQLKNEMAVIYKAELLKNGNYTMPEIEDKISMAKKSFFPSLVMGAIFGYLVIGAMVTAITAGFLLQKNKRQAEVQ
ncbi:MAG: hypothetical protein JWP81_889 [Ferruginibacter sp.]|nr:hypothetical protein [Ferruginibacter sp.]